MIYLLNLQVLTPEAAEAALMNDAPAQALCSFRKLLTNATCNRHDSQAAFQADMEVHIGIRGTPFVCTGAFVMEI